MSVDKVVTTLIAYIKLVAVKKLLVQSTIADTAQHNESHLRKERNAASLQIVFPSLHSVQ